MLEFFLLVLPAPSPYYLIINDIYIAKIRSPSSALSARLICDQ